MSNSNTFCFTLANQEYDQQGTVYNLGEFDGSPALCENGNASLVHDMTPVQNPYYGNDEGTIFPEQNGRNRELETVTVTNNIYYE